MSNEKINSDSIYGRVFVRPSKTAEYTLLDSSCFSKLDLRIYSEDGGNLHPDFASLVGKEFRLGFEVKNPDLLNGFAEKTFKSFIKLPVRLGENPIPDIENLEEAVEKELEICRKTRLLPFKRMKEIVKTSSMAAYWIFCAPGRPILKQNFLLKTCPFTMFDDVVEEFSTGLEENKNGSRENFSYRAISKFSSILAESINSDSSLLKSAETNVSLAKACQEMDMSVSKILELNRIGRSLLTYLNSMKEEAQKTSKMHGISCEPYLKMLSRSMENHPIEFCSEWKDKDNAAMIPIVLRFRRETVAGIQTCETLALQYGIDLSPKIKKHLLMDIMMNIFSKIFQKYNDFVSFAKEATTEDELGAQSNEIYLLHMGYQLPLEKALQRLIDDVNENVDQLDKVCNLLLRFFPKRNDGHGDDSENREHEELKRYIQMVKEVVIGHIQWCSFVPRFKHTSAFDCYVENY